MCAAASFNIGGNMSFDIDPQDKHERFLLCHGESGHIFEVWSRAEYDRYTDEDGCDNVTDIKEYEDLFQLQDEADE